MIGGEEMQKEQLDRVYMALTRAGYAVEVPSYRYLWITFESFAYAAQCDEKDPNFYRLEFPIGLDDGQKPYDKRSLQAVNVANASSKLAKVYLEDDGIAVVVDTLAPSPEDFAANLQRYLAAIKDAFDAYKQALGAGRVRSR